MPSNSGESGAEQTWSRIPWHEFGLRMAALMAQTELVLRADRKAFTGSHEGQLLTLIPPPLLPIGDGVTTAGGYRAQLPADLGRQLVLLMRAGACALGLWQQDELVHHKVFKAYVVRGNGRAQATYAKTRGKSRGGARLRLRNARNLLDSVVGRLRDLAGPPGTFDHLAWSCPVRLWADLCAVTPPMPAATTQQKIPWHVREPSFEALLRTRNRLASGWMRVGPVALGP